MELARNLRRDTVSHLDPPPPKVVGRAAAVADAVDIMRRDNVGCVLVCDDDRLVGLFTERDLMTRVLAVGKSLSLPVAEVMTPEPITVLPKDPIRFAIRKMKSGAHRHLPVVDEAGRAVGIGSAKGVVPCPVQPYTHPVYNRPP